MGLNPWKEFTTETKETPSHGEIGFKRYEDAASIFTKSGGVFKMRHHERNLSFPAPKSLRIESNEDGLSFESVSTDFHSNSNSWFDWKSLFLVEKAL